MTRSLTAIAEAAHRTVENIASLDTYAQAVDARITEVDNIIHGEMSTGRDQLRALERIVSEMRSGVAGPDNYNIGSPGGGGPRRTSNKGVGT